MSKQPTDSITVSQPPQTGAPEAEGVRASKLRQVYETALARSIKNCSWENFSACFPTSAKNSPAVLRTAWEQMCGFWETAAKREYDTILKERNVVSSLNQLDQLITEAEARKKAAPPGEKPISPSTLPPNAIINAHLTPLLVTAQENVSTRITAVQANNSELISTIEAQRQEIEQLVKALERNLGYLEGTVDEINGAVNGKELTEQIIALQE